MKKLILIGLVFASTVASAKENILGPCFEEMYSIVMDLAKESDYKKNIVINFKNEDAGIISTSLKWSSPKNSDTLSLEMVFNNSICKLK